MVDPTVHNLMLHCSRPITLQSNALFGDGVAKGYFDFSHTLTYIEKDLGNFKTLLWFYILGGTY